MLKIHFSADQQFSGTELSSIEYIAFSNRSLRLDRQELVKYSIVVTDFTDNNQSYIVIANYRANNVLVLIDYFIKPSGRQTNYGVESSISAK
jgi:hypothetical protein